MKTSTHVNKCIQKLRVYAIVCSKCGDTIYSRARHDFRSCSCDACSVDGGFDYMKFSGDIQYITPKRVTLKGITKKILYDDWAFRIDKYGRIPSEKRISKTR